jgi:[ribosomal protein S5]-alanine N-acetyltransferase
VGGDRSSRAGDTHPVDARRGRAATGLISQEDARIVGHCGLNHLERGPEIELAYLFDEPYWGQGFATEIAGGVLERALQTGDFERIVAVAFPENVRSIAVMKRIGMRPIGIARRFNADVIKYERFGTQLRAARMSKLFSRRSTTARR